jgi:hypothetical protein
MRRGRAPPRPYSPALKARREAAPASRAVRSWLTGRRSGLAWLSDAAAAVEFDDRPGRCATRSSAFAAQRELGRAVSWPSVRHVRADLDSVVRVRRDESSSRIPRRTAVRRQAESRSASAAGPAFAHRLNHLRLACPAPTTPINSTIGVLKASMWTLVRAYFRSRRDCCPTSPGRRARSRRAAPAQRARSTPDARRWSRNSTRSR